MLFIWSKRSKKQHIRFFVIMKKRRTPGSEKTSGDYLKSPSIELAKKIVEEAKIFLTYKKSNTYLKIRIYEQHANQSQRRNFKRY
jgi:hypothetical protein